MSVGAEQTQNLGRIVPEVEADRPHLRRTRGGSTLGRIDRYPKSTLICGD